MISPPQDLCAEQVDLCNSLAEIRNKLRSISRGFFNLFPADVDNDAQDIVGRLDSLLRAVEAIDLKSLPRHRALTGKRDDIAQEMLVLVVRVLMDYGINAAIYLDAIDEKPSAALCIVKGIGDDIGLVYEPSTWVAKAAAARAKGDLEP